MSARGLSTKGPPLHPPMTLHPAALSLPHLIRPPAAAAPQRPPAVFALHGRGSHEGDLIGLAPWLDDRLFWISPRAPLPLEAGYEWYRLARVGVPDPTTFASGLAALGRFVAEACAAYPVDPERIYLFGFSQGGMMAHALLLTQPRRVRGLVAHSSYLPLAAVEAAAALDRAGVQGKPALVLHGVQDPLIPVAWGRAAAEALTGLGVRVTHTEFAGAHAVTAASLAATRAWLKDQLGPSQEAAPDP